MKPSKHKINIILLSLLGRQELVDKWWCSPNKRWEMKTPEEVFELDPRSVVSYIAGQLNGDYS